MCNQLVQIQDSPGQVEQVFCIRWRGRTGSDHLQKRQRTLGADGIVHRQNPPRDDVDPDLQIGLQLQELGLALHRRNPVQQKSDFADMRAHFRHQTLLEKIDFDQLVQGFKPRLGLGTCAFQVIKV